MTAIIKLSLQEAPAFLPHFLKILFYYSIKAIPPNSWGGEGKVILISSMPEGRLETLNFSVRHFNHYQTSSLCFKNKVYF